MKFLGLKKNWKQWLSLLCLCIGGGTSARQSRQNDAHIFVILFLR